MTVYGDPHFDSISQGSPLSSLNCVIANGVCLKKPRFWHLILGFFPAIGTWVYVPQAISSLKVCHRAEYLSQGCTRIGCIGWPETPALRQRQAGICFYANHFLIVPILIVEWSCGVPGSLSLMSVYIFQHSAVLSEGWPPILYETSEIWGAKMRNIHASFCSWPIIPKDLIYIYIIYIKDTYFLSDKCEVLQLLTRWLCHPVTEVCCSWVVACLAVDQSMVNSSGALQDLQDCCHITRNWLK